MKKNEIEVGGYYRAKVSGNLVTVRVDEIGERESNEFRRKGGTYYRVTNLNTGRKLTFQSAAKFRRVALSLDVPLNRSMMRASRGICADLTD